MLKMKNNETTILDFLKKELPEMINSIATKNISERYPNDSEEFKLGYLQGYLEGVILVQRFVIGVLDNNSLDIRKFLKHEDDN